MAAINQVPERTSLPGAWCYKAWLLPLFSWLLIGSAGLFVLASVLLWQVWTTDGLRSIGIYIPIVSQLLTLRVWRSLNWETRGTWWGLLPLSFAMFMERATGNSFQLFAFTQQTSISLLPVGLTVCAYGSGIVLLLGGARVLRKAAFPVGLLLCVNPVPTAFAQIDLPLQYLCAHAAHAFAIAIGVHPDTNQLRLMFAPGFGMFIAPGCDGIRGAITMGYLSLVLGYVYQFSLSMRTVAAFGAMALGYVFNLIRLCALVLFYWVALRFRFLQPHGEGMDYLIGGSLFLVAAILFAVLVRRKRQDRSIALRQPPHRETPRQLGSRSLCWKGAVASILIVLGSFPYLSSLLRRQNFECERRRSESQIASILPVQMGNYRLLRTWTESYQKNSPFYQWGAYKRKDSEDEIHIAYWLGRATHYPIRCHIARGVRPSWHRVQPLMTATDTSATFEFDFYEEGKAGVLEATTLCGRGGCNEQVFLPSHAGFAFVAMGLEDLLLRPTLRPLPVLIRTQSNTPYLAPEGAQSEMMFEIRDFISVLDTKALVDFAEYRNQ